MDTSNAGTYVITYNVTDSDGNAAAEVRRTIEVTNASRAPIREGGGGTLGPAGFSMLGLLVLLSARRRRGKGSDAPGG